MLKLRSNLFVFFILLTAPYAANARTVTYDFSGSGWGMIDIFKQEFLSDGSATTTRSMPFHQQGSFTAQYVIDFNNRPQNDPSPGILTRFASNGGVPQFLTSSSVADIGGISFGRVLDTTASSSAQDGAGYPNVDFLGTGGIPEVIETYYASGAIHSITRISINNQVYSIFGDSVVIDGISMPSFSSDWSGIDATQQMGLLRETTIYSESGQRLSWELINTSFSGTASSLNITLAGPPVPEPASWAMMIGGLALAGAAMRRRMPVATLA